MKNVSSDYLTALQNAREAGLKPRRLIWFVLKDRDTGSPYEIGVSNCDGNLVIPVLSGSTGMLVNRTYYGNLAVSVSEIPRVSDLTIQTVTIDMAQNADISQEIIRGYEPRLARVEIHDLLLDPLTSIPVAPAEIAFLGQIDSAPINTPAAGEEGSISISVVSDAISMLSRTNSAVSSYQNQKRRSDDQWGLYKGTVGTWRVPWGQKS